jgi:hypothetical protein
MVTSTGLSMVRPNSILYVWYARPKGPNIGEVLVLEVLGVGSFLRNGKVGKSAAPVSLDDAICDCLSAKESLAKSHPMYSIHHQLHAVATDYMCNQCGPHETMLSFEQE